jgi:hypothetical protein
MALYNANPRPVLRGIKDLGARPLQLPAQTVPTHLPYMWLFTERGRSKPQLCSGDATYRVFGQRSFDLNDIYATHQTLFANTILGNANSIFVQRLKPADAAPPASIVLWLDVLAEQVPVYERNADGSLQRDPDTNLLIPHKVSGSAVTVPGYTAKWVQTELPKMNAAGQVITSLMITQHATDSSIDITPVANVIGGLSPVAGDRTNASNATSTRYPIFEFEADSFGAYGNNQGLRLSAVTHLSAIAANDTLVSDNNAFQYRLQLVERDVASSTANIVQTLLGEQFLDFMLKPGAYNRQTKQDVELSTIFGNTWTNTTVPTDPYYGPFGKLHVYTANVATISQLATTAEHAQDASVSAAPADVYAFNFLSGVNLAGNPYVSYQVLGPSQGGLILNEVATRYATGGSDGTMNFATFDALVANEASNFGDGAYPLRDTALYPFSAIYDSGFTLPTKYKLLAPLATRKAIAVHLATQDLSLAQNSNSADSAIAVALYNAARIYNESAFYGTSCCRVTVTKQSGKLLTSPWRGLAPLNLEIANKLSKYMGASDGIWKSVYRPDVSPANRVTMFQIDTINALSTSAEARALDWANGAIWAQAYDMNDAFFAAYQTVYDDDTSPLNNVLTVYGCIELEMVAERVWRDLTGRTDLTTQQFIERSNELIVSRTAGRFDNRFTIKANTFQTPMDANNGFSWSCEITIYANDMRTVGTYTIISRRSSDLTVAN